MDLLVFIEGFVEVIISFSSFLFPFFFLFVSINRENCTINTSHSLCPNTGWWIYLFSSKDSLKLLYPSLPFSFPFFLFVSINRENCIINSQKNTFILLFSLFSISHFIKILVFESIFLSSPSLFSFLISINRENCIINSQSFVEVIISHIYFYNLYPSFSYTCTRAWNPSFRPELFVYLEP